MLNFNPASSPDINPNNYPENNPATNHIGNHACNHGKDIEWVMIPNNITLLSSLCLNLLNVTDGNFGVVYVIVSVKS